MSLSADSRLKKKLKFALRKRLEIKQGLERIDYHEDVVKVELAKLDAGKPVMGLGEGHDAFDIVIKEEPRGATDSDTPEAPDPETH